MKPITLTFTTFPDPIPDFIYDGLKQYSAAANRYHPQPTELIEAIAKKHHLDPEHIFLTSGVDDALRVFAFLYGKQTFVFTPTYRVYEKVVEYGGTITHVGSLLGKAYAINYVNRPAATLFFLANPNNPVGFTPKETVIQLVSNNPQAIVVVDEAYADFAHQSVIDEVKNYKNLVVCRSFSKSFGMAGNRVGFFVAHEEVIAAVRSKTQWANVSYLSVGAAIVGMNHEKYFMQKRAEVSKRRDEFQLAAEAAGFCVIPSHISCALIKFKNEKDGSAFFTYLNTHQVTVNHGNGMSNIGLDFSSVRFAIGTQTEMETVQKLLAVYKGKK